MDRALRHAVMEYFSTRTRKRVPVKELHPMAKRTFPQESDLGAISRLHHLLTQLVDEGVLKPFSKTKSDAMGRPLEVVLVATQHEEKKRRNKETLDSLRETTVWCAKMSGWAADESTTLAEMERAVAVNAWLKANTPSFSIPHRERALDIFGDEKALDGVARKGLFGGRIHLKDLGCFHCPEPLHYEAISKEEIHTKGKPLLVVENANTYWSCCRANEETRCYAAIVYGKGNMINSQETGCDALWEIEERLGASGIHYFGDLDPAGLAIPKGLSEKRQKAGLSAVVAQRSLYAALIQKDRLTPCTTKESKQHDPGFATAWLGEALAPPYLAQAPDRRWPQEGISKADIVSALKGSQRLS